MICLLKSYHTQFALFKKKLQTVYRSFGLQKGVSTCLKTLTQKTVMKFTAGS
jgi:hypothetical protein